MMMNRYYYGYRDPDWDVWDWDLAKAGRRAPKGGGYYTNRQTGESRFFRGGQFVPSAYEESEGGGSPLPLLSGITEGEEKPKRRRRSKSETSGGEEKPKRKRRSKAESSSEGEEKPKTSGGEEKPTRKRRSKAESSSEGEEKPKRSKSETSAGEKPKRQRRSRTKASEFSAYQDGPPLLPSPGGAEPLFLPAPREIPPLPDEPEEEPDPGAQWDPAEKQWQVNVSDQALESAQEMFPNFDLGAALEHGLPIPKRILNVLGQLAHQERQMAEHLREQGYKPEEMAWSGLKQLGGMAQRGLEYLAHQEREAAQHLREQGYKPEEMVRGLGEMARQKLERLQRWERRSAQRLRDQGFRPEEPVLRGLAGIREQVTRWDPRKQQWQVNAPQQVLQAVQERMPHFDLGGALRHGLPIPRRAVEAINRITTRTNGNR